MKHTIGLLTVALILSACQTNRGGDENTAAADTSANVQPTSPDTNTGGAGEAEPGPELITPDGWGPLRIGMTRAQVIEAAGDDANPNAVGSADPEACDQFRPAHAPDGLLVMLENGVLTRITVSRNNGIATPEGVRVGDPGATVIEKVGTNAQVMPHKYLDAPARYITVWRSTSGGERRGIRYETDANDNVAHIHAGGSSIEYVEGCL